MKLKSIQLYLTILTILVGIALPITLRLRNNTSGFSELDQPFSYNLNIGDAWNLIGINVMVDDSDPNFNWSKTVADNEWCTGLGIPGNPYIIENLIINTLNIGSGLEIRNSNALFIIRNCTFLQSGIENVSAGVKLNNTFNGIVTNCSFFFNNIGILLESCENIILNESFIIDNNDAAVRLIHTNITDISENKINNNVGIGIHLINSHNNTISDNEGIENIGINGAFLQLLNSDSNTIQDNYIRENEKGILIEDSLLNVIYNNYFILNGQNALNYGTENQWYSGIGGIGNFWSDYKGYDIDDDGIGDSHHDFGTGTDYYPIYIAPPQLNIISPGFLKSYFNPPEFEIEISLGGDLDIVWYQINSTDDNIYIIEEKTNGSAIKTGIIDSEAWNKLGNGHLWIYFGIKDTFGRQFNTVVEIIKISKPPDLSLLFFSGIAIAIIAISVIIVRKKLLLIDISKIQPEIIFKIKNSVLILGKGGGRLEIIKISEETGEERKVIIPVIKNMIKEDEIDAEYFKSSKSIVFNRQTVSKEIDKLVEEYQKWEEQKKSKKV